MSLGAYLKNMKKEGSILRLSKIRTKRVVSLLLCLALLISTLAFTLTVRAAEADDKTDTGAPVYYLWGEKTNGPKFNSKTPTGKFSYDSTKGYYYYDLEGASGDYCFVISQIANSAANAQKNQSVTTVAGGGKYYVSNGNYGGFNCMHLWNPNGDKLRMYFTEPSIGLTVVTYGGEPTQAPATQAPTQSPTSGSGTAPTQAPATQTPTQSGGDSGKTYIYCENEAGWAAVYAYMWNSDSDKNAGWPGVKMSNIGGNIWRYEYKKNYAKIIFNIGSNQTQTGDMNFPGKDYIYNNKTQQWSIYDTSPLQVSSFSTDVESPQYNGVGITLSASAEGQGTVYYKFSVTGPDGTKVLSDFSTANSVLWVPEIVGSYTLTYEFGDSAGNTNKRTKTYVIEDGLSSVSPYIKTVSPSGGEILNNKAVSVTANAGGGITGTNLLFYKFTVKNSSGTIVNTPYYTLNKNYSFTPTSLGAYTLTVNVQGSDNKTIERTYYYTSVGSVTPTEVPETQPAVIPTQAPTQTPTQAPTQAPTQQSTESAYIPIVYGDADDDGDVAVMDATYIQRYEVGIPLPSPINLRNADVDGDEDVNVMDATLIQRYLVGIISAFPAE